MALAQRRFAEPVPAFARLFGEVQPRLPGSKAGAVKALRAGALDRFAALGIPTPRHESWRYINVGKLANVAMGLAPRAEIGAAAAFAHVAGGPAARRLIFVNGHLATELSHVANLPAGVRAMSLERALATDPERVAEAMARGEDERPFTALNTAFAGPGAWIELDDGAVLDEPLQLLFFTVGQAAAVMNHPRIVVRLGARSRLHLIESHVGLRPGHGFTNLVTQLDLAADAHLRLDRLQLPQAGQTILSKAFVGHAAGARLDQVTGALGGALVRNETEALLGGPKADCRLAGLYMPHGQEQVDTQIRVHHNAPDCFSDQFYKGVLAERAHAVFAGKIIVQREGQKTNAYQKNDNLLLSDEVEIDTKPELEIYADDVKCSHGATAGDLDPTALFYLRSRGLPAADATALLTYGFIGEVIDRFAEPGVASQLRRAALARLPGGAVLEGMAGAGMSGERTA